MSDRHADLMSSTGLVSHSASVSSGVTLVRERPVSVVRERQDVAPNTRRGSTFNVRLPKGLSTMIKMPSKMGKKVVGLIMRVPKAKKMEGVVTSSGLGDASIYHALVVIFLEFFAWGLLTSPMITVLNQTFPDHTFLMNGLIMGIKGLLSFLSAPLIGALSDIWGRKFFLLVTVFFTCAPIPLMKINPWWYFAMLSMSGIFAVTFSVVFAYVSDVTEESERSAAFGLVSATFAASLVTSPALGAWLEMNYSEDLVVATATAIAILDVLFIMVAVPESLPENFKPSGRGLTLEQVDPFSSLRRMAKDSTICMLCLTVFLSYLPEAGQYSCFFVYLRLVMGFSKETVAMFIAAIGILSVIAQTGLLTLLMKTIGPKHTIMVGLLFEMLQLMWYGFGSQTWMMWSAGVLASVSSITYPAISAFVSMHADADKQGLVQGMVTGIRGLCNGLGPAMYGLIFYLFHVDLNEKEVAKQESGNSTEYHTMDLVTSLVPGPPFVFGALLVILAILVAAFIPDNPPHGGSFRDTEEEKRRKQLEDKRRSDDSYDDDSDPDMEYKMPLINESGEDLL